MTIAIPGAGGFLGRACVAEARRRGLPVLALYRNSLPADWAGDVGITPLQLDLTAPDAADRLRAALSADCAIIHAAAHLGDDPASVARDTLSATRTLREMFEASQPERTTA